MTTPKYMSKIKGYGAPQSNTRVRTRPGAGDEMLVVITGTPNIKGQEIKRT